MMATLSINSWLFQLTTFGFLLVYVMAEEQSTSPPFTEPIKACIYGYTDKSKESIESLENCLGLCLNETEFVCNSIEYHKEDNQYCSWSKETKESQPGAYQEPCSGRFSPMLYRERKSAIHGGWSSYGQCSKSCKTDAVQTRTCTNPEPKNGGNPCSGSSSRSCNQNVDCPIHGGWSSYGPCSKSCKTDAVQTRTCTNPEPKNGGNPCSGSSSRSCNQNIDCVNSTLNAVTSPMKDNHNISYFEAANGIKVGASSTKDNNETAYGAHHVLDESTGWAITGTQKFPWIELELPKEQTISEIKIHIKPDKNKKYELRVGNEPVTTIGSSGKIGINQACEPSPFKIPLKDETITFKCGNVTKGRFITLQEIGEGKTNLEVKYFIVDLHEKINYLLIIGIIIIGIVSSIIIFVLSVKYCTQKKEVEKYQQIQANFKKELLVGDGCDSDTDQIENLPYSRKYEISIDQFTIEKVIGDGQFGKVCLGKAKDIYGAGQIKVAIKQVKSSVNAEQLQIIVAELKIMSNLGSHPNLVNMVGACTSDMTNNKIYILLEYCEQGDLKKVLLENRGSFLVNIGHGDGYVDPRINPKLLLNWCFQTAKGMEYLESLKIMHGDLAARNILIDNNFNAKISDFGLSKQLVGYQAYMKQDRRMIPWAWMGLEYLQTGEFNIKSDVWSFGVVLWEIYSLGSKPYGNEPYADVKKKLLDGYRLELPEHMGDLDTGGHIYPQVMMSCWEAKPENRPTFRDLVGRLEAMMEPGEVDKYNQFVEIFNKMQEKRSFATFAQGEESNKYIIDNSVAKENDQDGLDSNGYVFHASVDHKEDNSSEYVVFKNNVENKGNDVLDAVEYINV